MKLPDFAERSSTTEDQCRSQCLGDCSCIAYAYDSGISCMSWSKNLIDIQQFQSWGQISIFVWHIQNLIIIKTKKIVIPVIVGTLTHCVCLFLCCTRIVRRRGVKTKEVVLLGNKSPVQMEELPVSSLDTLSNATSQFHEDSWSGRFCSSLLDGQRCILDWRKRSSIIEGIGRGLLYLHRDSRLKIIHRDLKTFCSIITSVQRFQILACLGFSDLIKTKQTQGE